MDQLPPELVCEIAFETRVLGFADVEALASTSRSLRAVLHDDEYGRARHMAMLGLDACVERREFRAVVRALELGLFEMGPPELWSGDTLLLAASAICSSGSSDPWATVALAAVLDHPAASEGTASLVLTSAVVTGNIDAVRVLVARNDVELGSEGEWLVAQAHHLGHPDIADLLRPLANP